MSLANLPVRLALAIGLCLGIGCGGDDGVIDTCGEYGELACQLACDCTEGDGCAFTEDGFTITFDNSGDCQAFFSLGCGEEDLQDIEMCADDIQDAACVELDDGTLALEDPGTCD